MTTPSIKAGQISQIVQPQATGLSAPGVDGSVAPNPPNVPAMGFSGPAVVESIATTKQMLPNEAMGLSATGVVEAVAKTQLGEELRPSEEDSTSVWPRRMSDIRRVKPIDSWVLPVKINGVPTHALIDTGAGCCLLSKAVFEAMPKSRYPIKHRPRDLHAVGGLSLKTIGDLVCDVVVNGRQYAIDMVVSTQNESIGCILGMDFLQDHDCELSVRTGHLFIGGMKVSLRRESTTNSISRIRLREDVTLPPRCEMSVSGKSEAMTKRITSYYSCVEPSACMQRKAKDHILAGCAVVQTNAKNVSIPIMNTGNDTRVLRKGTVIGIMKATAKVSEDPTDNDPLRLGADRVRRIKDNDVRKEDNGLSRLQQYEHIAPLMNDISDDITPVQRGLLQEALMEFADVFSSGPEDMGGTDYVKHTIDTGDSRPIRLPPRRLPIAKQDCETEEVQKMLKRGVIEPSSSPWASPVVLVTKRTGPHASAWTIGN